MVVEVFREGTGTDGKTVDKENDVLEIREDGWQQDGTIRLVHKGLLT